MTYVLVFCGIWLLLGTLYGILVVESAKVWFGSLTDCMEEVTDSKFQDEIERYGKQKVDTYLQISFVLLHSFFWVYILINHMREA